MSQRTPWENEFWTPPAAFKDATVFCFASGPSLTRRDCAEVYAHRGTKSYSIAVNSSLMLAPWATVLFFTDSGWYEPRRQLVESFGGVVVTHSRTAKRELPAKINRVRGEQCPDFPPLGSGFIRQGRSSGHGAVSLAVAMGAKRVVLLGYDMRLVDGEEHHHAEYAGTARDTGIYEREFLPAWAGWNEAALARGTSVFNATSGSALSEFPMIELEEALTWTR